MNLHEMTEYQLLESVRELRTRGYAVVVFTPEEIANCDSSILEDLMVERGWLVIEDLGGSDDDEEFSDDE